VFLWKSSWRVRERVIMFACWWKLGGHVQFSGPLIVFVVSTRSSPPSQSYALCCYEEDAFLVQVRPEQKGAIIKTPPIKLGKNLFLNFSVHQSGSCFQLLLFALSSNQRKCSSRSQFRTIVKIMLANTTYLLSYLLQANISLLPSLSTMPTMSSRTIAPALNPASSYSRKDCDYLSALVTFSCFRIVIRCTILLPTRPTPCATTALSNMKLPIKIKSTRKDIRTRNVLETPALAPRALLRHLLQIHSSLLSANDL
jgi:hypothetical protein